MSELQKLSNYLRILGIKMVQRANSGHPGIVMGAADIATVLYKKILKFNPQDPNWKDRDRFVLSAGHGSALLYGLLYLTGYEGVNKFDIESFRQYGAKTAGHPEFGHLPGIEATTGPLGQGIVNAVGMAIAETNLRARFDEKLVDHYTYALCGDGCLMEGISQEAISLAGHLKLNKLVFLYDKNDITIDGRLDITDSTDVRKRFEACGWSVFECDGHNLDEIEKSILQAKNDTEKPSVVVFTTKIGYKMEDLEDTPKVHGSPLGEENLNKYMEVLNAKFDNFNVPQDIMNDWGNQNPANVKEYEEWNKRFESHKQKDEFNLVFDTKFTKDIEKILDKHEQRVYMDAKDDSTRADSGRVVDILCSNIKRLIGGSADLSGSNCTKSKEADIVTSKNYGGHYIHYGIREHAMAAIMNGMALHGGIIPFGGTFLVFSDYMKPAIRLSALMKQRVVYVMTHDSIGLGEDGPTHQPVEHLTSLRSIPNLNVFRPADAIEVSECWDLAIRSYNKPSVIVLSRQKTPFLRTEYNKKNFCEQGGYYISSTEAPQQVTLAASGTELSLCRKVKTILKREGIVSTIVSMPCLELFDEQDKEYKEYVLGDKDAVKVFIEASSGESYRRYMRPDIDMFFGVEDFGVSAPYQEAYKHFGLDPEIIADKIIRRLKDIKVIMDAGNAGEPQKQEKAKRGRGRPRKVDNLTKVAE